MTWIRFFLLVFLSAFAACRATPAREPGTVVIGVEAYPESFDPRLANDAISSKICRLLYNGLFKLNERLEVVPDLAAEVKQVNDLVLEVRIRDGVLFHDLKPLTINDFLATYESVKNPALNSPHRSFFEKIQKIEALDSHWLRFTLKEPFSPLITGLTLGIVPERLAQTTVLTQPMGSGPYRFIEATDREKVVVGRFDEFFGEKPKNQKLIFRSIYDDTLRTLETLKGRLDLVQNAVPIALLPSIPSGRVESSTGINFSYLGFNLRDPILSKRLVREAIALAINRPEMIQYKLKGLATPAGSLLFPDHWAHANLTEYAYDPERAKALLDEAGFPDPDGDGKRMRFKLTYKTSTKKDRVEMALLVADYLRKIGIELDVQSYEWGTFFRDIRMGNFQLYSLTWVGIIDPDIYYLAFHSSQIPPNGSNRGAYANPELDRLVEEGRKTSDLEERKKAYAKAQEIIQADLPYVPLWYEHNWAVRSEELKGYQLRPNAGFEGLVEADR